MSHDQTATAEALEALLDGVDCGRPPAGELLVLAQVRRHRRRWSAGLAAGVAVVVVLAGTGLLAELPSGDGRDAAPVATAPTSDRVETLEVDVLGHRPATVRTLFGQDGSFGPRAAWDADSRTIVYTSRWIYSGTCPPDSTATSSGSGSVAVLLVAGGSGFCTSDARSVTLMIHGLDAPPDMITVTEGDASITSIPVLVPD